MMILRILLEADVFFKYHLVLNPGGSYFVARGRSRTTGTHLALLLALGMIPKLFKPGRKCT